MPVHLLPLLSPNALCAERTVASYMRAVLRTLAQCHAQHILHRDIKPGEADLRHQGGLADMLLKLLVAAMLASCRSVSCSLPLLPHLCSCLCSLCPCPGNFLLLSDDPNARLKAIDFGLAVFFEEDKLPRTDLGLEGTPWCAAAAVVASRASSSVKTHLSRNVSMRRPACNDIASMRSAA